MAVPVQKMLRWRLLFSRMQEQLPVPGRGVCSRHLSLPFIRAKDAVCMNLAYASCQWNLEQNLIYLIFYFGDKEQHQDSSNDYSLVMILHSRAGLVNWLSRTAATRIWVANMDMKTWANIENCGTRCYASQDRQRSPSPLN